MRLRLPKIHFSFDTNDAAQSNLSCHWQCKNLIQKQYVTVMPLGMEFCFRPTCQQLDFRIQTTFVCHYNLSRDHNACDIVILINIIDILNYSHIIFNDFKWFLYNYLTDIMPTHQVYICMFSIQKRHEKDMINHLY